METLLQLLVSGLALGAIYALIALGFSIIFQAGIVNFAQGSFMLLGAYTVSWLVLNAGINFFLALFVSIIVTVVIGMTFDRYILSHVHHSGHFTIIMLTFGLDTALRAIVIGAAGGDVRLNGDVWGRNGFNIGELRFNINDLLAVFTAMVMMIVFFLAFKYSKQGIAMRAVALDTEAAAAVGINVPRVNAITWAISSVVTTIAAVFLAGFPRTLEVSLGDSALKALPAIVLGGFGSNSGAIIGGIIVGLAEVIVGGYGEHINKIIPIGSGAQTVAPYIVLIIVLLVRPQGFFGKKRVDRV
jgi:branched-chain amino acid transport system permease protein